MFKDRKARMIVNKSGGERGGSSTFRVTLPASWVRKMGLNENKRNLRLEFDGKEITIKNNEEEIRMLEKLLRIAKGEVEKEIDLYYEKEGEIEELSEALLEEIETHMKKKYKHDGSVDDSGAYTGCYYKNKDGLKNWREVIEGK